MYRSIFELDQDETKSYALIDALVLSRVGLWGCPGVREHGLHLLLCARAPAPHAVRAGEEFAALNPKP